MANSLNINLKDRHVVIGKPYYSKYYVFKCLGGFGSDPMLMGNAVIGHTIFDEKRTRIEGWQIIRLANPTEIADMDWDLEVKIELKGEHTCSVCGLNCVECIHDFTDCKFEFVKEFYVNNKNSEFMFNKINLACKQNTKIKIMAINGREFPVNSMFVK